MPKPFDPYHTWLGIPPNEQPPTYYRLLGLAVFEENPDVISNAADRQMLLLRTFQTGRHSAESQRLLNEVASAKVCLLNPQKKAAYDEQLRQDAGPSAPVTPGDVKAAAAPFDFEPQANVSVSQAERARRRRRTSMVLAGGLTLGLSAVVVLTLFRLIQPPTEQSALKVEPLPPIAVSQGEVVDVTVRAAGAQSGTARVTYELGPGAPEDAQIDPHSGRFRWQPTKVGTYQVTILAMGGRAGAAGTAELQIEVLPSDEHGNAVPPEGTPRDTTPPLRGPTLADIPDQTIQPGNDLVVVLAVEDPGEPASDLTFSLVGDAPPEMRIDARTGRITWRPDPSQAPGEFQVRVAVVSGAEGNPGDEKSFFVRVAPESEKMIRGPKLAAVPDQVVETGQSLDFTPVVEDPGEPQGEVTFRLRPGAPEGMTIDERSGRITWTPAGDSRPGRYHVGIVATSNAPGQPSDETTFAVELKPGVTGPRQPIPTEADQSEALAQVKERFGGEYRNTRPHARLALAARLIVAARESESEAEQYASLREAERLAQQQGDTALVLAAVDALIARFELDAVRAKADGLQPLVRQTRDPTALGLLADAATGLARQAPGSDAYPDVVGLCRQIEIQVKKSVGSEAGEALQREQELLAERQALWEASQAAATKLSLNAQDAQANHAMGEYHALVRDDWDRALAFLAQSPDEAIGQAASGVAAQRNDPAAQLALADAWWDRAEKEPAARKPLFQHAARHWYRRAAPRLTGDDLQRAQQRLAPEPFRAEAKLPPLTLRLGGVGGQSVLSPKEFSGNVKPTGGFAAFQGRADLEYASVPACSYVHEFELTLTAPAGSMALVYGEPHEGARISFSWEAAARSFVCRLYRYRGGWSFWSGARNYAPGERLRFTLYANASRHILCHDGAPVMVASGPPADLFFRVQTRDKLAATLSRCEFRPWTEADARRLRCPMPPLRVEGHPAEAAVRFHERNVGLNDRPNLSDPGPFVVATSGTPMVWIEPGTFERKHSRRRGQSTEVVISQGFWMGRYEITQAEWTREVGANPSRVAGSPFLPVDGVSREEAGKFCTLITQKEGRARRLPKGYEYRLPTEAEWEYACRAGSQDDFSVPADGFWSESNSGWRPHEVGEGKPNPWGLYDMHGNVEEWCYDAYRDEPDAAPARVENPLIVPTGPNDDFVLRGGAWWTNTNACASGARAHHKSVAGGHRGFRLVLGRAVPGR